MAASPNHVWVGTETGILKGLNLVNRTTTNFTDFKSLDKQQEILAMCWPAKTKEQILLGLRNGIVKEFNVNRRGFTSSKDYGELGGQYVGIATVDDSIITCLSNGNLTVWKDDEPQEELDLGANLKKMKQQKEMRNVIAVGGIENDLKVYDLEKPEKPLFEAKNVRHNFLDLRVPVWINDIQFLPGTCSKIVTCTAYHQVRLYDYSTPRRRPVIDVEYEDCPLMSLDVTPDQRAVIVGNAQGKMAKIDFRMRRVNRGYRGCAGSIRHIVCHPSQPLVGSCGLDRFFRVHSIESGNLEYKIYLKSRLNCFLFSDQDHVQDLSEVEVKESELKTDDEKEKGNDSEDELWDGIEDVADETAKRKRKDDPEGLKRSK